MKNFEISSFGMKEMTMQETRSTEGGSLTVLLICAAAAFLLSSCIEAGEGATVNVSLFNNNTGGSPDIKVGVQAE